MKIGGFTMSTCFFTYSWETDEKKAEHQEVLFSYIKKRIEDLSDDEVEVIYDKRSFHEGDNFRKREEQLRDSDCVLVFFTPEYKQKVLSGENSGVVREYDMVRERAESKLNGVIPILFSGNLETAVTDEFMCIIHWDISKIKHQVQVSHERTVLGDELEAVIDKLAKRAIREANATAFCREHKFSSLEEEYNVLFLDTQAVPLPADCIVRTTAHTNVIRQTSCIVIGRKGSGKSTLLNSIRSADPQFFLDHYKTLVALDVENIDITRIFDGLISQVRQEFNIISMPKVLDTFWEIVFVLQGIATISNELDNFIIDHRDYRYDIFVEISEKLKEYLGTLNRETYAPITSFESISHCATEMLTNHIKHHLLDDACAETPITGAYSSVNAQNILCKVFGPKLFKKFCTGVGRCSRKILLALDGFDTHSDDFRVATNSMITSNPNEAQFRSEYEVRLFRELLLTVSKAKRGMSSPVLKGFFDAVHFCIILPQDRFDDISSDDRDIVKRSRCTLSWDAYDLIDMLVKRLEYFYKIVETDKSIELCDRFYKIIRQKMPNIPTEIEIEIDGHIQKMPLFNYLLRNSFWRPRDIIKNFAIIMKLNKETDGMNDPETVQHIIKKFLYSIATEILEEEFYSEYKNVYFNLEEVLLKFRNADFIQDYTIFSERLSKIQVHAFSSERLESSDDKLFLFYKLGIIGLYYNKGDSESHNYGYNICYIFNEGLEPIKQFLLDIRKKASAKIIFNPIFVKNLALNFNTKELVCNYDWKYIKANHALKDNIRRL